MQLFFREATTIMCGTTYVTSAGNWAEQHTQAAIFLGWD